MIPVGQIVGLSRPALRDFHYPNRVLAGHGWKIVQELIEWKSGFKIVDERVNGNTSAAKHWSSANDFGIDGNWKALDFLRPGRGS